MIATFLHSQPTLIAVSRVVAFDRPEINADWYPTMLFANVALVSALSLSTSSDRTLPLSRSFRRRPA
jgi:hypothetical protein